MPSKRKGEFQKRLEKVFEEQKEEQQKILEEASLKRAIAKLHSVYNENTAGLFIPDVLLKGYTPLDSIGEETSELKPVKINSKWTVGKAEKDGTFKREDLLIYYHVST